MNAADIGRCSKRIVQYIWDPEPRNDREPYEPIWCLGVEYPPAEARRASQTKTHNDSLGGHEGDEIVPATSRAQDNSQHSWPEAFITDFESRIWMTYRSNFAPIPKLDDHDTKASMTLSVRLRSQLLDSQGFTSDTGWGCMIRSGQSLLINAMVLTLFGRDWRRGQSREEESKLLSLFADSPNAPFSIHRFVQHGAQSCGKFPGEWFGPSATARCIQALCDQWKEPALKVYVTNDTGEVYRDKFMNVACNRSGTIQPTLILLGIRLGIDRVTPVYWNGLKAALQFPQSVGIAGGRPSASHYFVGHQGSQLFYLDPHFTRPALPSHDISELYSEDDIDTYHTRRLRRMHLQDMDPSMLIGFLIQSEEDWQDWVNRVNSVKGRGIIHIIDEVSHTPMERNALDEVEVLDDTE
ncbi:cysteine protease ATG4 [Aspergillus homomorphus CBS 101889]|uniref:Cysteine protease n=1 Tax=Aspergillus homomorphus (strain CBS 101889) TaxID=1450537 RepID=A0A395HMG6_ASPHC|nr:hypothetical protein BO97DRAFT_408353 [Aspergillus homomorphus CBS 101889]RAL08435.1 hypothetical protein BO97DRAFT_408353 [Aspergillus homomorphus CBS 101889]